MDQPPPVPIGRDGPPPVPPPAPAVGAVQTKFSGKKLLLWGCGIVLGIGLLAGAGIGIVGYFGYKKAKEAGIDFANLSKEAQNQTLFTAKILAATMPDLEVVSANDTKKEVTIRIKSTGQIVTLNLNDLQEGKLPPVFTQGGVGAVELNKSSSENGPAESAAISETPAATTPSKVSMEVQIPPELAAMSDATLKKFPTWLPTYAGGKTLYATHQDEEGGGVTGTYTFVSTEDAGKIVAFYEEKLKAAGFHVEKLETAMGEQLIYNLDCTTANEDKKATVVVAKDAEGVNVSIHFSLNPSPAP